MRPHGRPISIETVFSMETGFSDRLIKAKERARSKQKIESMLRQSEAAVATNRKRKSTLQRQLEEERADVTKLEGLSLTGLFLTVLGKKDERLDSEKQELLAARLKLDEAVEALREAEQEVRRLQDELRPLADADDEFARLLEEKERLLEQRGGDAARGLLALSEVVAELSSERKEFREAVAAGKSAVVALKEVSAALRSAANWGTWDMMGGGMLATMAKHSKIDAAKRCAHNAQRKLGRFQEELADADKRLRVSLEMDGFSKFADFFFDGLIADWMVQSKIKNATSSCSTAIAKVEAVIRTCEQRQRETTRELEKLSAEREALIERATLAGL